MTTSQHELHPESVLVDTVQARINDIATCTVVPYKRPDRSAWQNIFRTLEQLNHDHGGTNPRYVAYGVQTGALSGGLEMWELEGDYANLVDDLGQAFADHGRTELWERITSCTVDTPSGGIHFIWRPQWGVTPPEGNKKLARTETGAAKAETRGEGGMFVGPGSSGTVHPDGKPWTWRTGDWSKVPSVTLEEREFTFNILAMFDDYRKHQPAPATATSKPSSELSEIGRVIQGDFGGHPDDGDDGLAPGEDFNQRADWEKDILPDWPEHSRDNHYLYITRPGKNVSEGPSATISFKDQRLWVFTTSTEFEAEQPYSKFGAYTLLTEGSTSPEAFSRAASKLRKKGYGTPRKLKATAKAGSTGGSSQDHAQRPTTTLENDNPSLRPSGQTRMAYRLENEHAGRIMYVDGLGWHHWDGTRWARDTKDRAKLAVLKTLRKALAESITDESLRADVRKCESAAGLNGVLDIASALPQLRVAVEDLDADEYLLNTKTGTVDLRTYDPNTGAFQLRPHDPADFITKVTGTGYDPNATAPDWEAFLPTSLPDPAVRGFLQRYVGQATYGRVMEQKMVIATGDGRNGKGVIARVMAKVLGDYAITANNRMLVAGRYKQQSAGEQASLMRLRGARWADMSELEKGDRLAESTMKSLTGGDTIEAKFMHSNPVQFKPSHSFFMLTNDLPAVDADDHAIWARMLVIPFNVSFKGREDHGLEDRLALELSGILTWALQGLADYQAQGLNPPEAVLAKTNVYRFDNDAFAQFIEDRCVLDPNATVTRKQLNEAHRDWAISNGVEALNPKQMVEKTQGLQGVEDKITRGVRYWKGLGLKLEQPELD